MLSADPLERKLQLSGIILILGLVVESLCLLGEGPIARMLFAGLGGILFAAVILRLQMYARAQSVYGRPMFLTPGEITALLAKLPEPLRTAAELDAFTGLRPGELIGLQWQDVDFENLVIPFRRSVVMMVQGAPKTEASAKDVPLDAALAESLLRKCPVPTTRPSDWVFASARMNGKQPYWPETLLRRHGRPAVKKAQIPKRVGFHTFRHTYTTLLAQDNEDMKVVQELLRHANSRITLDLYAQAGMPEKRLAQSKVVNLVLKAGKAAAQLDHGGNCSFLPTA